MSKRIYIHEVVTRDGFQIEPSFIETEQKIELLNRISRTGVAKLEVTSLVSPKAVPNLGDAETVLTAIDRNPDVAYVVLVPNCKGAERAVQCHVDEVNMVISVSETHNRANIRRTHEQSFQEALAIRNILKETNINLHATLATAFGCPFEGITPLERVLIFIDRLVQLGIYSITLADTTGMAHPLHVKQLVSEVLKRWPDLPLTLHFHNTRGLGLANVLAGLESGVIRYDAALGGLGGCPFAPGATGNICTEDLIHMLEFMGYDTAVNLDYLLEIAKNLPQIVGHEVPGQVIKAGKITDLHTAPVLE